MEGDAPREDGGAWVGPSHPLGPPESLAWGCQAPQVLLERSRDTHTYLIHRGSSEDLGS